MAQDPQSSAIRDAYLEVMMEDPGSTLASFVDRVMHGEFGPQQTPDILEFLADIERDMIASIYVQLDAHPGLTELAQERIEQVRSDLTALRHLVRTAPLHQE
jgi:hypothetical protein